MAWVALFIAGAFEAVWALALKQSESFSKTTPTLIFVAALIASMLLLALALRTLPLGPGYTVWTGTGAVGAVLMGILLLDESAALDRLAPVVLIAGGIVWLATGE